MTYREINQGEALYIINSEGIVYHQHEVLYIIKPQVRCTLARDEIQPEGLMICTALRAAMICQACGLDKKIRQVDTCRIFCAKATKKIFFAFCNKVSNSHGITILDNVAFQICIKLKIFTGVYIRNFVV